MKHYYPVVLLLTLIFSFWAVPSLLMATDSSQVFIEPPDTLEGLKIMVLKALGAFPNGFKIALAQAKVFWNSLVNWLTGWWRHNWADKAGVWLNHAWQELKSLFLDREAIFKKELDAEKKEMGEDVKTEIPELQKTFLEKFKEIIK